MSSCEQLTKHSATEQEIPAVDDSNDGHGVVSVESVARINITKGDISKTSEKKHVCDECGSVSQNMANLKKHMLTHTGEKPFKCNACPKAFRQKHHLSDHKRTHTGERPFKCDQCGTRFVQKSSLNLHKKKHSGVKPHTCNICSSSFYEKMGLKMHMRKHTGEKPYQCDKCGQAFSTSTRLNFHLMIHTGERRYKCEECGVRFREKVTLQQHRGVHVNLGPFVCTDCGQEFSRLAGLSLHRKVHAHKDDYLYVYDKDANKDFASATLAKAQNVDGRPKEHSMGIKKSSYTKNKIKQKSKVGENENECSESLEGEVDHDKSSAPDNSSLTTQNDSSSPRKLASNDAEEYLQKLKENLVSNLNDNAHSVGSYIHPDHVKAALETGKLVETEDDEGNTFIILLPPSLKTEDVMLMSDSPQSKSILPSNSVQSSNFMNDVPGNESVLDGNLSSHAYSEKVCVSHGKSRPIITDDSDICVELHEEVSAEGPDSFTVEVSESVQDTSSDVGQVYSEQVNKEAEWDTARYSRVWKDIHPDGTSLLLWNESLELNNEITYIIDEGSDSLVMIDSQEVPGLNDSVKQKKKRIVNLEKGKRCRKQKTKSDSNSPLKITVKSKKVKEKKIRMPKTYNCDHCGKECKTSSNYIAHMRTHSGERPYFCDYCRRGFKQIAHLRAHVRIHTGDRPYVCDICNFAFTQCSRLKSHIKTQHSEAKKKMKKKEIVEREYKHRSFYCKFCKKTLINECFKIEHMKNHRLSSVPYVCKICGIQYKTKASLMKHRLTHADYHCICEVCGMSFVDLASLQSHREKTHLTDATESSGSDLCISVKIGKEQDFVVMVPPANDMATKDKSQIQIKGEEDVDVIEASNGQVPHKVIQVTDKDGFVRNQVITRPGVDEVEHIDGYKVSLVEENHMEESASIVRGEKKATDELSNYDCASKNDEKVLRNELSTVSKSLKKIKEEQSDKNYKTIIDEFGKKIWACKLCDKTFLQSSNMHSHLRMHTGERPYQCNECCKAFKQITHLKDHMSRHTGIKPYMCSACKSCFAQRSAVMRHIRHVHGGKATALKNTEPVRKGKENAVQVKKRGLDTKIRKASEICKASHMETHITCRTENCESESRNIHSEQKNTAIQRENKKKYMKEKYSCCTCQATFHDSFLLKSHIHLHHNRMVEVCDECGMVFRRATALKFHQNVKHGRVDERYRDFSFIDVADIKEEPCSEAESELGKFGTVSESDGEEVGKTKRESCDEEEKKADKVPYSSKHSEKADGNGSPIKSKELEFTDSEKYACRSCLKVFSRLSTLRNHETMWCKSLEDHCKDIESIVSMQEQLPKQTTYHSTRKKGRPRKNRICSSDDDTDSEIPRTKNFDAESFYPESGLAVKANASCKKDELTGEKFGNVNSPLYCKICRKEYTKVNSYKVHMSAHLNKRPFRCDLCNQAFNQKAHLTSHYRRHTGERPYKCHHCPRAFTQPHCLKSHIKRLHLLTSTDKS